MQPRSKHQVVVMALIVTVGTLTATAVPAKNKKAHVRKTSVKNTPKKKALRGGDGGDGFNGGVGAPGAPATTTSSTTPGIDNRKGDGGSDKDGSKGSGGSTADPGPFSGTDPSGRVVARSGDSETPNYDSFSTNIHPEPGKPGSSGTPALPGVGGNGGSSIWWPGIGGDGGDGNGGTGGNGGDVGP